MVTKRAKEKLQEEEKDTCRGYEDLKDRLLSYIQGRSEHGGRGRTERK